MNTLGEFIHTQEGKCKMSSLHMDPSVKSLDLCVQFEVYIESRKLERKHG